MQGFGTYRKGQAKIENALVGPAGLAHHHEINMLDRNETLNYPNVWYRLSQTDVTMTRLPSRRLHLSNAAL